MEQKTIVDFLEDNNAGYDSILLGDAMVAMQDYADQQVLIAQSESAERIKQLEEQNKKLSEEVEYYYNLAVNLSGPNVE